MKKCSCNGYGYFWPCEINGYKGPLEKIPCRDCNKLSILWRIKLWFRNYKSNEQVRDKL